MSAYCITGTVPYMLHVLTIWSLQHSYEISILRSTNEEITAQVNRVAFAKVVWLVTG